MSSLQEKICMSFKYMKRWSISLIIMEIQILNYPESKGKGPSISK